MAGEWNEATTATPCPACGKPDWCSTTPDHDAVLCMRSSEPPPGYEFVKSSKDGGSVFMREGARGKPPDVGASRRSTEDAVVFHDGMATRLAGCLTDDRARALADDLGVSMESLRAITAGYDESEDVHTFPERNARGRCVGIQRRYPDGSKKHYGQNAGGKHRRGLIIPDPPGGLDDMDGPVLLVEGASDVAACLTMGIAAVGRPSNKGGAEEAAKLLEARKDEVIVVGEMDAKADGSWPGRDGAVKVAGELSSTWNAKTRWAIVPNHKDVRSWMTFGGANPDWPLNQETAHDAGRRLCAALGELSHDVVVPGGGVSPPGGRPLVANVIDERAGDKVRRILVNLPRLTAMLHHAAVTSDDEDDTGWPRSAGGALFSVNGEAAGSGGEDDGLPGEGTVRWLTNANRLFAWIGERCDLRWEGRREVIDPVTRDPRTPPTKAEFFEHLGAASRRYRSVELLPHEPPIPHTFYVPVTLPESDGEALEELTARLNPETEIDRLLMVAALLTPGWGAPHGKRPAFVFSSVHGRGSGKTETGELFARLWGGPIRVGEAEDWEKARARMLDDSALSRRVVLVDNVKRKFSKSGIEQAITCREIDGKRMYVGNYIRPNTLTWFMTSNVPDLSTDLTMRSIVIRIGPPKHDSSGATWASWVERFCEEKRARLIADCFEMLRRPAECEIPAELCDRWGPWREAILTRFPEGVAMAERIRDARPEVDADLEDARQVAGVIVERLIRQRMQKDPATAVVAIPKKMLRAWLEHEGIDVPKSTRATTAMIKNLLTMDPLAPLAESSSRRTGSRDWLWTGADSDPESAPFLYDHGLPNQATFAAAHASPDGGPPQSYRDDEGGVEDDIPF